MAVLRSLASQSLRPLALLVRALLSVKAEF